MVLAEIYHSIPFSFLGQKPLIKYVDPEILAKEKEQQEKVRNLVQLVCLVQLVFLQFQLTTCFIKLSLKVELHFQTCANL